MRRATGMMAGYYEAQKIDVLARGGFESVSLKAAPDISQQILRISSALSAQSACKELALRGFQFKEEDPPLLVPQFNRLRVLELNEVVFCESGFAYLLKSLKNSEVLERLVLSGMTLRLPEMLLLMELIQKGRLRVLDLSHCSFQEDAQRMLVNLLLNAPESFKELCLTGCTFSHAVGRALEGVLDLLHFPRAMRLLRAAYAGHYECINDVLASALSSSQFLPLHAAAAGLCDQVDPRRYLTTVQMLLSEVDVNTALEGGVTAAHVAMAHGKRLVFEAISTDEAYESQAAQGVFPEDLSAESGLALLARAQATLDVACSYVHAVQDFHSRNPSEQQGEVARMVDTKGPQLEAFLSRFLAQMGRLVDKDKVGLLKRQINRWTANLLLKFEKEKCSTPFVCLKPDYRLSARPYVAAVSAYAPPAFDLLSPSSLPRVVSFAGAAMAAREAENDSELEVSGPDPDPDSDSDSDASPHSMAVVLGSSPSP